MKGNSENMSSAVWRPKIATVQITERTGPRAPFENNSGKKVYSKVTIPAGGTSCFDVDLNIGSEVKILHDRRTKKLVGGYCLFICVYSALIYGLTTFQLESTLTITNHRVNLLQQEMRWMASNYRQMKQKMLSMKLSLDELLKKHRYDESLNSEESPTIPQFIGTDGELLSQSAPNMLSSNEINSDVIERIQATKSNEDNVPVVSGTSDQSGFMSSHNLILREYDEIVNNHLKNNKSVSVSDNVTSFQNVFNQSELQSGVPFVDNIISLDTFSDYESVPVEDFDQDKEDSTGQSSRVKRSNRRGKNSRVKSSNKAGNRHHKKPKMRGPVAAHFKGGQIETVIRDGGRLIAPWYPDEEATGDFGFSAYEFREGMGAVEVTENGLYLLYAQAYYLTTESLNSFSINIMSAGQPDTPVAFCSTSLSLMSTGSVTEASCFTSVVRFLNATTRVTLKQRERNRRMILREGYTFLGLVKLNSQQPNKGRRGN